MRKAFSGMWLSLSVVAAAGAAEPQRPRSVPVVEGRAVDVGTRTGRTLSPAVSARLAAFNATADQAFEGQLATREDRIGVLSGGRIWLGSRFETADRLLAEHGPVFGFDDALEVASRSIGDREHLSFALGGVEISDARGILMFDGDDLVGARFDLPDVARSLGAFDLAEASAVELGKAAATADRGRHGLPAVEWAVAVAQRRYVPAPGGLVPTWQVEVRSAMGDGYDGKSVFIDARDGSVVRIHERVDAGQGHYPFFGQKVLFQTTKGKARAFKNVNAALASKSSKVKLTDLAQNIPAPVNLGFGLLVGSFMDSWDANNQNAQSVSGNFSFDPLGFDANKFDQANTYFHITAFANKLQKDLQVTIDSAFSMPVVTNVAANSPNAFFTPDPFPLTNPSHTSGFILIQDVNGFGAQGDVGRDIAVIGHEYTHAWLSFEQLNFFGAKDHPARGFNEGIADAYAMFHHNDHVIGRVMKQVFTPSFGQDFSRDLQDDDRFPETTIDSMTLTQSGFPEEHRNGEIAAAFMLDLRAAIGVLKAKRLIFAGLPFTPATESQVDPAYAQINSFAEALNSTEDFYFACVNGILKAAPVADSKAVGAIIGAATARGIIGDPNSFNSLAVDLEVFPGRKMIYRSQFLTPGDQHVYFFRCQPGRTMKIGVTATKKSFVNPNFALIGVNPAFDPFATFTQPKKVAGGAKKVTQSGIKTLLPPTELYMVTVSATNFQTGGYQLVLDA